MGGAGPASVSLDEAGVRWFACRIGRHCQFGQKFKVTVHEVSTRGADIEISPWSVRKYDDIQANVGDVLILDYSRGHNVEEYFSQDAYDACSADSSLIQGAGPASVLLDKSGVRWFACRIGRHCQFGQKFKVTVHEVSTRGADIEISPWSVRKYDDIQANVGDILHFDYSRGHNVEEYFSQDAYDACSEDSSLIQGAGPASVSLDEAGVRWFACRIGRHCQFGQKFKVTVHEVSTTYEPTIAPSIGPTTGAVDPSSPSASFRS